MRPFDIAQAWFEMCRTGDEERLRQLSTEDYLAHGPGGSGDRDAFTDWLRWYPASFADQQVILEDVIVSDDRMVVRYRTRSIYQGGYLDLPGCGQDVEETGIIIFRLADGRVAETWFEGNDLEVARQLGGSIRTTHRRASQDPA